MKKLIFGIDGGGTKSHMAVFDQLGQCVAIGKHGPLNHESMAGAFAQLEPELSGFIKSTLAKVNAKPEDVSYAVMGIAGVDTIKQHAIISAMVDRIGLQDYLLCNDAFLGIPAGCPGGVGICAINGTGSTMAAIDHSGRTVQIGGIGAFSNDCGGSSWFGERLLAAVYGDLFKCETNTVMTGMLMECLGVTDADDYVEAITKQFEDGTISYASINRMVFEAAAEDDEMAIRILDESAAHYAGGITYLATNMDFPAEETLHVTLAGSVFVKEKVRVLPNLLAAKVHDRLPGRKAIFHPLATVPVAGAVYLASIKAGFDLDIAAISKALAENGL
ncbi:MAG: hypothetical protein LBC96_09755 [Lachnospiraceae bacterium]|jgi:N-acetylglucosamine kinase-like BadF-type ATPase|nr:hypothetical protein [Lachnospiraceae bacterium]